MLTPPQILSLRLVHIFKQGTMFLRVVLLICIGSVTSTNCPDRWLAFECDCYLFGHDAVQFTEAEDYCRIHNSHLVQVQSSEESMFLKDFMTDLEKQYWLGMTDKDHEGTWRWIADNSRVHYTDWGGHEPTDSGTDGEDCAVFWKDFQYRWGDYPCTGHFRPLCEFRSNNCDSGSNPIAG